MQENGLTRLWIADIVKVVNKKSDTILDSYGIMREDDLYGIGKSKVYQAVAYYKLSKDDGDKGESNSIINQRKLIHEFVSASGDITLADEKQDDGYTGQISTVRESRS